MDYYKLRSHVMQEIKNHLEERQEYSAKGLKTPKFSDFSRRLMVDYGVTEKMITKMVETLVPSGTVKNGEIVRKNV